MFLWPVGILARLLHPLNTCFNTWAKENQYSYSWRNCTTSIEIRTHMRRLRVCAHQHMFIIPHTTDTPKTENNVIYTPVWVSSVEHEGKCFWRTSITEQMTVPIDFHSVEESTVEVNGVSLNLFFCVQTKKERFGTAWVSKWWQSFLSLYPFCFLFLPISKILLFLAVHLV